MSNDETLNASIRGSGWLIKAFPFVSDRFIDTVCWSDYDDLCCDLSDTALKHAGNVIGRSASPDELRYIHENAPEAFEKLGLVLPEPKKLTDDQLKWVKPLIARLERNEFCDPDDIIRCDECMAIMGAGECAPMERQERADLLRKGLAAQEPKALAYTIPEELTAEQVEWIQDIVTTGECGWGRGCTGACDIWVNNNRTPGGSRRCGWTGSNYKISPEYLRMFEEILEYHRLPDYTVPALDAKEQKIVRQIANLREDTCSGLPGSVSTAGKRCDSICIPIMIKIFGKDACPLAGNCYNSPQRAKIIRVLEDVLAKQDGLLPPHNVVQFGEPEYGNWERWTTESPSECPAEYEVIYGGGIPRQVCKKYCGDVFPDKGDSCPCHAEDHGEEITRIVIEKCLAKGPKVEEFVEFDVWDKVTGEKQHIVGQEASGYVRWDNGPGNGRGGMSSAALENSYTLAPPQEKAFERYLAVIHFHGDDHCQPRMVLGPKSEEGFTHIRYPAGHESHERATYWKLQDPDKAHAMLHELSGEKGILAAVKAELKKLTPSDTFNAKFNEGCRMICNAMLSFIADLEGKAKTKGESK